MTHNNLKNLKNNFCVHPDGGWPGEGVQLVYWPGCGEERLKLNFFELGKTNSGTPDEGTRQECRNVGL